MPVVLDNRLAARILESIICVVLLTVLAVSPLLGWIPGWTLPVATLAFLRALSLIGLNLIFGITGMLALGQAAFAALPGYIAGMLEKQGTPVIPAIITGVVLSTVIARLLAEVFVRLPGIYLAIGTLGFAFVIEGLARAFPTHTGGASGLVLAGRLDLGPIAIVSPSQWYLLAISALTTSLICYTLLVRGRFLRVVKQVRSDELAAQVLGIDVVNVKILIFTIGSTYSAIGGVLVAHYVGVLIPESAGVGASLKQLSELMLGGAGYLLAPVLGAATLEWLFKVAGGMDRYQLLVYGLVFLIVVLYTPQGLAGLLHHLQITIQRRIMDATTSTEPTTSIAPSYDDSAASPFSAITRINKLSLQPLHPCLTLQNISKRFGGLTAVDNVSLECWYGEVTALIGPNGAGKTTLFNLISGVELPSTGNILLNGQSIIGYSIPARARLGIGRAFQVPRLIAECTVVENVMLGLEIAACKLSEQARREASLAELRMLGLLHIAERRVAELSTGQRKLVEVARAAVSNPLLLMLDEPAVGLSPDEIEHLLALIAIFRKRGSAVFIIDHNIGFVETVSDKIIVMHMGRIIAQGTAEQIIADNRVQEAYLGSLR